MLYLEDYLEMIEQLPMDLRERFTEMREMDLQVQNTMDNLDDKVKKFFEGAAANKVKSEVKQQQYELIQKEYYKVLEDADEKVQLANQVYDSVERYLRKLDQEVNRFKMELEADHAGITSILERRSLELDRPPKAISNSKAEKRKLPTENNTSDKRVHTERLLSSVASEAAQEISGIKSTSNAAASATTQNTPSESSNTALSYTLGHVGAGSNAIAMAAARAVTNTLQMQQGRRTASMKASFEAVKATGMSGLTSLSREFTFGSNSSNSSKDGSSGGSSSGVRRSRKHGSSRSSGASSSAAAAAPPPAPPVEEPTPDVVSEDVSSNAEWTYDPNEPRYCLCNQVSYGNMVGCDNPNCPIEWFHYGCVGITQPPKGKWFCPQCAAAMKRREKKDNPHKHKGDSNKSSK